MMFGRNRGAEAVCGLIPKGSVGVEIGVWKGDSSELFLQRAGHLHLVDPWSVDAYRGSVEFGGFDGYLSRYKQIVGSDRPEAFQDYYDRIHDSVVKRFEGRPVTIHRCTSEKFFTNFPGPVDWVYVDGGHSKEVCYHDLIGAIRISNRYVFGDDYGTKPGVTEAVDSIVSSLDVPFKVFAGDQFRLG